MTLGITQMQQLYLAESLEVLGCHCVEIEFKTNIDTFYHFRNTEKWIGPLDTRIGRHIFVLEFNFYENKKYMRARLGWISIDSPMCLCHFVMA